MRKLLKSLTREGRNLSREKKRRKERELRESYENDDVKKERNRKMKKKLNYPEK